MMMMMMKMIFDPGRRLMKIARMTLSIRMVIIMMMTLNSYDDSDDNHDDSDDDDDEA